jgi:hypothetical protein
MEVFAKWVVQVINLYRFPEKFELFSSPLNIILGRFHKRDSDGWLIKNGKKF